MPDDEINMKFCCISCDFKSSKYSNYQRHLMTRRHQNHLNGTDTRKFNCDNCGKAYKHSATLYSHKKQCIKKEESVNIILELVKQNSEFKDLIIEQNKQLVEQNKQIIELSKEKSFSNTIHNTTNNNNNNNQFNLNFFLNETCKDAMNINDFVEQLPIYLSDLEDTARLGFAEGLSRIFIRGLKQLDVNQRPIHCSDAKRETLYIKDNDKWEKDDCNKSKLETVVRKVGTKNIRMIPEWKKAHPNCTDYDSNKNDLYLKIVGNSMCGGTVEETENNYSKIKKNIIKHVIIQKTNV
jgi:hypothetical protein